MFIYFIYGQYIESEIKLYNIPETKGNPTVFIKKTKIDYSQVPEGREDYYYTDKFVCFKTSFGEFSISDGKEIRVFPYEGADMHLITSFIIGYSFSYLFSQRGATAFHCTALDIFGNGVLISGVSGAGKSTTAFNLIKRGHKYMADDVAMMFPLTNMEIAPAFPIQKICAKDIEGLDKDRLLYINEDRDKYSYYNYEQFQSEPRIMTAMFNLVASDVEDVIVEEVTGLNKYLRVLECQFLVEPYSVFGTPERDKINCLKLAEKIHFYKITRPKQGDSLDKITSIIEDLIKNQK